MSHLNGRCPLPLDSEIVGLECPTVPKTPPLERSPVFRFRCRPWLDVKKNYASSSSSGGGFSTTSRCSASSNALSLLETFRSSVVEEFRLPKPRCQGKTGCSNRSWPTLYDANATATYGCDGDDDIEHKGHQPHPVATHACDTIIGCSSDGHAPHDTSRYLSSDSCDMAGHSPAGLASSSSSSLISCSTTCDMSSFSSSILSTYPQENVLVSRCSKETPSEYSIERVDIIILCFVSLPPSEATEECFTPMLHLSYMDMRSQPLAENGQAGFHLVRFRSQLWVGVVSTGVTRQQRCHDVLQWVRCRRTLVLMSDQTLSSFHCDYHDNVWLTDDDGYQLDENDNNEAMCRKDSDDDVGVETSMFDDHRRVLQNAASSDDEASTDATDRHARRTTRVHGTGKRRSACLASARLRECTAVMLVSSGEAMGLSPLKLPPGHRAVNALEVLSSPMEPLASNFDEAVNDWMKIIVATQKTPSLPSLSPSSSD